MPTKIPAKDMMNSLWANSVRVKSTEDNEEYVIFRCEFHGDQVASDPLHFPEYPNCLQCSAIGFLYRKTLGDGKPIEDLYSAVRASNQEINEGNWDYKPLDKPIITVMDDDEEDMFVEPENRILLPN